MTIRGFGSVEFPVCVRCATACTPRLPPLPTLWILTVLDRLAFLPANRIARNRAVTMIPPCYGCAVLLHDVLIMDNACYQRAVLTRAIYCAFTKLPPVLRVACCLIPRLLREVGFVTRHDCSACTVTTHDCGFAAPATLMPPDAYDVPVGSWFIPRFRPAWTGTPDCGVPRSGRTPAQFYKTYLPTDWQLD